MRFALLLGLVGCDDTLFGVLDALDTSAVAEPTYQDVEGIWMSSCAGCHTDGGSQGGLALDAGSDALVYVTSSEAPELSLVVFGDPPASYLWLKLTDDPGIVGSSMPPGQSLSAGELGTVENWITTGP